MSIYTPQYSQTLDNVKVLPQIRLAVQGFGGTGKTWAALTFPNPVVINLDRGLGAHIGRKDVIEVPFCDESFCKKLDPRYHPTHLKDLLISWVMTEGPKLTSEQTLIWDGNTSTQNAYHKWYSVNKVITSRGEEQGFAEWNIKKQFYGELLEQLKSLACHVVFITHEIEMFDKKGNPTGKVRPLLTGGFAAEFNNYFTDCFRQLACNKPTDYNTITDDKLKDWCMTKPEFVAWCSSFPRNTIYYWQTESSDDFDGKCSSLVTFPRYLPATYQSFVKFRRKIS